MLITETLLARYRIACHFADMRRDAKIEVTALNRRQILLGSAAAVAVVGRSAQAQVSARQTSVSALAQASHSSLQLVASPKPIKSGLYQAGIALQLKPSFKTYWRYPGDSGVPPTFNFEGSQNLASAEVLYPAPKKFADGAGGFSYGYDTSDVLFPVLVTATDPTKPVHLRLKADYAVCESICILAHGEAALLVSDSVDDRQTKLLATAHADVPKRVQFGQGDALKIVALKRAEQPENFLVDVQVPTGLNAELFLEGETPWFFETKGFTRRDAEHGSFLIQVIERSKAADCTGADLTLTLVAEKMSIEVATRLDLAMVTH